MKVIKGKNKYKTRFNRLSINLIILKNKFKENAYLNIINTFNNFSLDYLFEIILLVFESSIILE